MILGKRIFFSYLLIFIVCFYFPIGWMIDNLRARYFEGVEDPLADQANVLATLAGIEMASGTFHPDRWTRLFNQAGERRLSAKIYKLMKTRVDVRIYVTDASGIVLFDSHVPDNMGKDFSKWRDVHLTLMGQYGARTSLADPDDPTSSVLFVSAPIIIKDKIAGVLTVAKPTTNIHYFLRVAKPQIIMISLGALIAVSLLSLLTAYWITRPIKRLTNYANDIRLGKRPEFPKLDRSEIGEMGFAFELMKETLEGKRYVEQYVQTLTHEIKSPLSAIRGAAELLTEEMPADRRERFQANIRNESLRIQQIVDRMLALAALENKKRLQKVERISLRSLTLTVLESLQPISTQKSISPVCDIDENLMVSGDSFLLFQAVSNLLSNAIDFSPRSGQIKITATSIADRVQVTITDEGPGIPDFAKEKVFNKFFSLQRPDTGKKSTGLGLNFVKEVAVLHGGDVRLENMEGHGCRAVMEIPIRQVSN